MVERARLGKISGVRPNESPKIAQERFYDGNPNLTEGYIEALMRARRRDAQITQNFIYDPQKGLSPDMLELIDRLRKGRIKVNTIPMTQEEWERGHTEGRDFISFLDRYYLMLPLYETGTSGGPIAPNLLFLTGTELDNYWLFFARTEGIFHQRVDRDGGSTEKLQFLHDVLRGVIANLDEEYKDHEWTTKQIALVGNDKTDIEEAEITEALRFALFAYSKGKVYVSIFYEIPETTDTGLREADIIVAITKSKSLGEPLHKPGLVKNGAMVIEVQLEDSEPKTSKEGGEKV